MADIQQLTTPYFEDGSTRLNADNLNPIVAKINEIIVKVNGGVTPTQTVATPEITFNNGQATIICSTPDATIYYTKNGGNPTTSSTEYTGAISVVANDVIKAIAVKEGYNNSSVATDTYNPSVTVEPPTIIIRDLAIIMTCATSGATIRYTTDGTEPTSSSTAYTNAFTLGSSCPNLKAKAFKDGASSSVVSASFTYNDATGNDARQPQIVIENKKLIAISNGLEAQLKYSIDGATYVNYTEPVELTGACNIHLRTYTTNPETGTAITRTAGINFDNSNNNYVTIPHEGTASRRITAAESDDTQLSMHASSGCSFAIFPIISGKSYLFESVNNDTASAYYGYINEIPSDLTVSTIAGKMPSQPTVTAETLQTINITAENYAYILCCAKGISTGGDTYANNPLGFTFAEIIG